MTRLGDFLHFGQLFKPLAPINLPKYPTCLGNFCKGVKIYNFSGEIIFGQLLLTFGDFSGHTDPSPFSVAGDQAQVPLKQFLIPLG